MLNVLADTAVCTGYIEAGIPSKLAYAISLIVKVIQIVIPLLLIVWGMLDLGKAVIAQKEEEIKKGQSTFIKRIIAAIIVFFVVTIVKLLVGLVADADDSGSITDCIDEVLSCNSVNCKTRK